MVTGATFVSCVTSVFAKGIRVDPPSIELVAQPYLPRNLHRPPSTIKIWYAETLSQLLTYRLTLSPQSLSQIDQTTGLPDGWIVKFSKSKSLPYYFNVDMQQSQWEPPHDADQALLGQYMAEHFSTAGPLSADGSGRPAGKIRCAHLLVKHNQSRRASSWKQVWRLRRHT
jgi:hypothetical protein